MVFYWLLRLTSLRKDLMKTADNTVSDYVDKWLGKIDDPNLSHGDKISVAYAFSVDIVAGISEHQLTQKQVHHELRKKIQKTPSRNLARLRHLPKELILRASSQAAKGKNGASYSQLLYAMKLPKAWRALILTESMNEELGCEAFADRVDALTCDESNRLSCWTEQSEKVFEQFLSILNKIDGGEFTDTFDQLDQIRRRAAIVSLHAMIDRMNLISKEIARSVKRLTLFRTLLKSDALFGPDDFQENPLGGRDDSPTSDSSDDLCVNSIHRRELLL